MNDSKFDHLMKGFFEAEMPKPWPAFTPPAKATVRPLMASNHMPKSRLSLLVAMALLIGFIALMSSFLGNPRGDRYDPNVLKNGTATVPKDLRK